MPRKSDQNRPNVGDTVSFVVPVEGKDIIMLGEVQDLLDTQFTIVVERPDGKDDLFFRFYADTDWAVING